jgi:hypothetical protein
VADSTAVLALECARRRRSSRAGTVNLAASQRLVRAQRFSHPSAMAHFRLLTLVSAGRDRGSLAFESETIVAHVTYLARLMLQLDPGCRPELALTDLCDREAHWRQAVLTPLSEMVPQLSVRLDPERRSGRGYYRDVCFKLYVGDGIEMGDGGATTWTRQLLSDAKERMVISGLGVDRLITKTRNR